MRFLSSWGAAGVLATALLNGCAKPSPRPPGPATASATAPAVLGDTTEDRLAKAHAHYAAGVVHEVEEDLEGALQEYQQAALDDPQDEGLVLEVSRRLMQNKETDRALEVVTRAAAQPTASAQILARLALLYSDLAKPELAMAADREAIKKDPGLFSPYQNLFLNCLQTKQKPEAYKVLDEAAKQPEADPEFLVGVAELYAGAAVQDPSQKSALQAKALALLKRAEQRHPPSATLVLRMADAFNLLGDNARAATFYLDALDKLPDLPPVRERIRAKLTDLYIRAKDPQRAIEQLEAILHDDPTNPQANYFLGGVLYEQKKLAEAADYFSKTILFKPDMQEAYFDLAQAQLAQDKPSEALATLDKARERFPQSFLLEYFSGAAFSRQNAYAQALDHYTAAEVIAQATDPKLLNQGFYFQVGAASERKGDIARATRYFQKALDLQPDFAEALNYLGYMWAERGTNLDQARQLIEKAVKLEPKNAAYLDSLAWVFFKLNQPKAALPYALQAVQYSEQPDATVYEHLGDIYAGLKQMDDARAAWRKSLSLQPNDDVKKKLEAP